MNVARSAIAFLGSAGAFTASGCDGDGGAPVEATLLVDNRSDLEIQELYLTEVDAGAWGPNRLAGDPLLPEETILLHDIECDSYDALLIDEVGIECELLAIDLCFTDSTWIIRNKTCAIFTADGRRAGVVASRSRGPEPGGDSASADSGP